MGWEGHKKDKKDIGRVTRIWRGVGVLLYYLLYRGIISVFLFTSTIQTHNGSSRHL